MAMRPLSFSARSWKPQPLSVETTSMRGSVAKALRRPPSSVVTVAPRMVAAATAGVGAEGVAWVIGALMWGC